MKRTMTLVMVIIMVLSCFSTLSFASANADESSFTDVIGTPSQWANIYIEKMVDREILDGIGGGKFNPEGLLTREQFAKVLVLGIPKDDKGITAEFSDVVSGSWYEEFVKKAVSTGIMKGYSKEEFGVSDSIKRCDMALGIARLDKTDEELKAYEDKIPATIEDREDIPDYAKGAMGYCYEKGIFSGDGEGNFKPFDNTTRAQIAKVICVYLESINDITDEIIEPTDEIIKPTDKTFDPGFVKGVTDIKDTLDGKIIQFYAAETWGHPYDNRTILYPQLKNEYGLTVHVKPSVYLRDTLQNIFDIKARKQIDLIGVGHEKLPLVFKILQPLNDKIDLSKAPKGLNQSLMNTMKNGDDILYLPQYGSEGIAYNVNNFKQAGLEEPYDLMLKGQWTWSKFEEYCKFFTEDNDRNGQPEKWGFGSWERTLHEFPLTNNTSYYVYNADGTITSNISNDAVMESLNFEKKVFGKNKCLYLFKGVGNYPEFYTDETVTMIKMNNPHNPKNLQLGMVAMPKGPRQGSKNIITTQGTGYGLPATMVKKSNEKAALLLLSLMLDFNAENLEKSFKATYGANPRWREMYKEVYINTETKMMILYGVGDIVNKLTILEDAILDDSKSIEETVQQLEATFENEAKNVYNAVE